MEWIRDNFTVTCDPAKLNLAVIHTFLSNSYWSKGIPVETVKRSLEGSLCFAVMDGNSQIGLARVISDFATIAYLGDVFILPEYRGRGLSKWLMECVIEHPNLQSLRGWILATRDAHGLYRKYGFTEPRNPERYMVRSTPNIYSRGDHT